MNFIRLFSFSRLLLGSSMNRVRQITISISITSSHKKRFYRFGFRQNAQFSVCKEDQILFANFVKYNLQNYVHTCVIHIRKFLYRSNQFVKAINTHVFDVHFLLRCYNICKHIIIVIHIVELSIHESVAKNCRIHTSH